MKVPSCYKHCRNCIYFQNLQCRVKHKLIWSERMSALFCSYFISNWKVNITNES